MKGSAASIALVLLMMAMAADGSTSPIFPNDDVPPPTDLKLWNMDFGVMATWAPAELPPGTDERYEVYRSSSLDPTAVWTLVGHTGFTNINDTEVVEGTWYYCVITVTELGVSNRSEAESIHYDPSYIDMSDRYDVDLRLRYFDEGYVSVGFIFDMSLADRMEKVSIITLMRTEGRYNYDDIARIDPGQDTYFDLDVDKGKTYHYRVIVEYSDGTIDSHDDDITIPGDPPTERPYLAFCMIASLNAFVAIGICLLGLFYNLKVGRQEKRDLRSFLNKGPVTGEDRILHGK